MPFAKQVKLIRPLLFGGRQRYWPILFIKHKILCAFSNDAEMRLYLIRPVMRSREQCTEEDRRGDEEGQVAW